MSKISQMRIAAIMVLAMFSCLVYLSYIGISLPYIIVSSLIPLGIAVTVWRKYTAYLQQQAKYQHVVDMFGQQLGSATRQILAKNNSDTHDEHYSNVTRMIIQMQIASLPTKPLPRSHELADIAKQVCTTTSNFIHEFGGTIDCCIPGRISAFWNAPLIVNNSMSCAAECAIKSIVATRKLNQVLIKKNLPTVRLYIALETGDAVVSKITGGFPTYTIFGNLENKTAHLLEIAQEYSTSIIIGSKISTHLDKTFIKVGLDPLLHPTVNILVDFIDMDTPGHISLALGQHKRFIDAYREERWERAGIICTNLKGAWDYKLKDYYTVMLKHCQEK